MSCNSECEYEKIIFNNSEWKKSTRDSYVDKDVDDFVECTVDDNKDDVVEPTFFTNCHHCQICNKTRSDNFIILNCNHTFHINCLANIYGRDCAYCHHPIHDIELTYLHDKFCYNAERTIINMNRTINKLKAYIKKLQESIIRSQSILTKEI
jgi:hypothetical protein